MDYKKSITAYLPDICIQVFEPISEFLVMLSIFDQRVGSVEDDVRVLAVGEPLEEGAELRSSRFKIIVLNQDTVKARKTLMKRRDLQKSERCDCFCRDQRRVCHTRHTLRKTAAAI